MVNNELYYSNFTYSNELYHHGIKGQQWGVRRYQNEDGTYTSIGKERRRGNFFKETNGISDSTKNKLKTAAKIGAVLAVTAGVATYAAKNPEMIKKVAGYVYDNKDVPVSMIAKAGSSAARIAANGAKSANKFLHDHKDDIVGAVKKVGSKTMTATGKALERAGDAALNAAMAAVATVAITKIAEKYAAKEDDSERTKFAKKVAIDSATAAIKAATNANVSSNNSGNNKGGNVGKDVTDAIGGPSNRGIDRSSVRYQALFKDSNGNQRDPDTRSTIKSMASAGYDIDQIERYLEIKHSYMRDGLYHSLIRYKRR